MRRFHNHVARFFVSVALFACLVFAGSERIGSPDGIARERITALMERRADGIDGKALKGDLHRAYMGTVWKGVAESSTPYAGEWTRRDGQGTVYYARWTKKDTYVVNAIWADTPRTMRVKLSKDIDDFSDLYAKKIATKRVGWGEFELEVGPDPVYICRTRLLMDPVDYVVTDFRTDGVHRFDRRGHHPQGGSRFDRAQAVWTCDFEKADRYYMWHHWEIPGVPERFKLDFAVPEAMKGVKIGLQLAMGGAQYEGVLDDDFTAEPPPSPRWKVVRGGDKGSRSYPMRVIQFFAERGGAPKAECPIALGRFVARTRLIGPSTAMDVKIDSTTGPQPRKLDVQIRHDGIETLDGILRAKLTDWSGNSLGTVEREVTGVKPGELRILELVLPVPDVSKLNYYGIDVTFADWNGRRLARYDWDGAWTREVGPYLDPVLRRDSSWGVNATLERSFYGSGGEEALRRYEQRAALASAAGLKWNRGGIEWHVAEPEPGKLDWTRSDRMVETCRRHGLAILGTLGCSWPKWVKEPWTGTGLDAYTNFLARAAARYKDDIRDWEIWNEPNYPFWEGTDADYNRLLSMSIVALKAIDLGLNVVGISAAGVPFDYIGRCVTNVPGRYDIAYHPYRANPDEAKYLADITRVAVLKPDAKQWLTEMGGHTGCGGFFYTERTQGVRLFRQLLTAAASDRVRASFIYDLVNDGDDANYSERNFGLVRSDFSPKPAYRAIALLGRTFREGKPEMTSTTLVDGKYRLHEYRQGRAMAVWTDSPKKVRVPVPAGVGAAVNLMDEPYAVQRDAEGGFVMIDENDPVVFK